MNYTIRKVRTDEKAAFVALALGLTQFNIDASMRVLNREEIETRFTRSRERFSYIFDQTM